MIITADGYSLTYYADHNKIVIILPQTIKSLTNTVAMVTNRKTELTEEEQATILAVVRAIMDGGADDGRNA